MRILNLIEKIPKRFWHFKLLLDDLKTAGLLNILESGIDSEGDPYIKLSNGETFFSTQSSAKVKKLFSSKKQNFSKKLTPDTFGVVLDYVQRYFRENSDGGLPSKSYYLKKGDNFIDCGAFIGMGSIKCAKQVGPAGMVIAIEGDPDAFRLLKKNIKANHCENIHPIHAVINNQEGPRDFYTNARQSNSIYPSLKDGRFGGEIKFRNKTTITGRTIDSIIKEANMPVKNKFTEVSLEINGAELEALQGMTRFLKDSHSFVLRIGSRYLNVQINIGEEPMVQFLKKYPPVDINFFSPFIFASRLKLT